MGCTECLPNSLDHGAQFEEEEKKPMAQVWYLSNIK